MNIAVPTRCFYCGEHNGLLLCCRFTPSLKPAVNMDEYRDRVVGMEPCATCANWMKQGVLLLTVRDGETGDNPHRTGGFYVVREEPLRKIVGDDHVMFKTRWSFIEESAAKRIGIPVPHAPS